jgi:dihydroneopterin aldolase
MTGDRLELRGLLLDAPVGVLESEKLAPQPIRIDLDVELDLTAPGGSDDLEHTVNYADIVALAEAVALSHHHELLESIADEIGRGALALDARIDTVEVTVTKLHPPVPQNLATVAAVRRVSRAR